MIMVKVYTFVAVENTTIKRVELPTNAKMISNELSIKYLEKYGFNSFQVENDFQDLIYIVYNNNTYKVCRNLYEDIAFFEWEFNSKFN
jgi:hypothetical protein